jgi:hopanoid-associated phosphorylase
MSSPPPALLVVTGLRREARIAAGHGVVTLCSGGDPALLKERLSALYRPHPASSFETRPAGAPRDEGGERTQLPFRAVLSFGLAGGLAQHLRSGDVVISSAVETGGHHHHAHEVWHEHVASALGSRVSVHRGPTAGRDLVLAKSSEKTSLHKENGALAVDMESHIAAEFARRHNLPFAAIRAISDPSTRNLPPIAMDALTPNGKVAVGKVIMGILRDTDQLPALIAAALDSERAFASLRRCRRLLGPLFGLGGTHL